MEIKYLETVLITADYLSFSRAAEEIPCAQSSVSRQVGIVESELGAKIFTRSSTGSVALTGYGTQAIPMIREIVGRYSALRDSAYKATSAKRLSYRLGTLLGPFNSKVRGNIVSEMFLRHPDIFFTVQEVPRSSCTDMLLRGRLDAMLLYYPYIKGEPELLAGSLPAGILCDELFGEIPHIAMPLEHPLACRERVSFGDLKGETFLLPRSSSPKRAPGEDVSYTGFLKSCRQAGFEPAIELLSGETMADIRDSLVSAYGRMYPTFQTKAMRNNEQVAFLPVEEPLYYAKYYLLSAGTKPGATQSVRNCLKELLVEGDAGIFY